jgi:hypothetical protein
MRASAPTLIAIVLLACGGPGGSGATEPALRERPPDPATHSIPGGRVRLWLPEGFERVPRLPVFTHAERDTTVTVAELSVPVDQISEAIEGMLGALRDQSSEPPQIEPTEDHIRYRGLLAGRPSKALILWNGRAVANVLVRGTGAGFEAEAERILRSVELHPEVALQASRILGFEMDTAQGLVPWDATSTIAMYREEGVEPPVPAGSPGVTVSFIPLMGRTSSPSDIGQILGAMLRNDHPDLQDAELEETRVGHLAAHSLTTHGEKDGTELFIHSLSALETLEDGQAYGVFILVATVDRARTGWHDRLKHMVASFVPQ